MRQWCTDPWSIAKCFINAPGHENKSSAADIDCTGLLHLIVNNKGFHDRIQTDLNNFSKVIEYRNEIFHSSSMELEEKTVNTYIQDMIAVLQDGKELYNRQEAQDAVKKLQELMEEDFIITIRNEADVLHAAIESIENKLREKLENVPTRDEVTGIETRVITLEKDMASVKEEMEKLKTAQCSQRDYIRSKLEFQEKLIKLYRETLLQVSAIPLQPERNHCNFSEVYTRPRMTCQATNSNGQKEEIELNSMSDIFTKDGIALKSIYVLGDAGAGKSSFCTSLVDYWCSAHCERQSSKDEFNGVKEMKKFDFLFYISLRHCKDVSSIQEMLEKQYKNDILTTLLDKESTKIIIVLDGLDEWCPVSVTSNQFQTEGLPELDNSKDFTIVTTSRPWKIATLAITDREVQKKLTLKGFDRSSSVKEMIDKSVPILNASFDKNKPQSDCEQKLANISLESIIQVPILLLQLICLWFDDKLENETSKCAIYTGILELFFSWNEKKKTVLGLFEEKREMSEDMQELPQYLIDRTTCKINKYLIHTLARLAYATLFKNTKETSLTFDSSMFEQLEISDEVKICCLRLGILSEDKCPSLTTGTCKITVLSFVHKSVQEYLAAVHIAIMFRARLGSSADLKNVDISDQCTQFIKTYFSNCATLDAVLEQENVIIMLCGLEPRIATSVSKYIYDVVTRDARVIEYRRTVHDVQRHSNLISNIQQCILNSIEEVQECQTGSQCNFYLGDVVCWAFDYHLNQKFLGIKQYILPDSVRSYNLIFSDFYDSDAGVEYMHKCRGLEMIHIRGDIYSCMNLTDTLIEKTSTIIDLNVSTLKTLSVVFSHNEYCSPKCNRIKLHLPNMRHLVALALEDVTVTHDDLTSLCTFLSGTSQLEQISIVVDCECKNKHEVDLSKHQQLQYLGYKDSVTVTRVNTSNLEIFKYRSSDHINFEQVLTFIRTTQKLNKLSLTSYIFRFPGQDRLVHTAITNSLISLLPLSHKLRELYLNGFLLTENIIESPSEMKDMNLIYLDRVRMSLTTWMRFVDSLPAIPQAVTVKAWDMYITRDGEECNPDIPYIPWEWQDCWEGGGEEATAFQYVRDQEQLFRVDYGSDNTIRFSTRK